MNVSFLRGQRLFVFLSLLSKVLMLIVLHEQNFLEVPSADCVTGWTVKKYLGWSIFISSSSFRGWHLNAIIFMLGGKDSHRDRCSWAGTPRIQSSSFKSAMPVPTAPSCSGLGLCTDGFSLGKETAPFYPTIWWSKESKAALTPQLMPSYLSAKTK